MEWRIRESGHGGYVAERGMSHKGGVTIPGIIGYIMPAFIVYESANFDTLVQAERFVKRRIGKK